MNLRTQFDQLAGAWTGINRLWLSPDAPARESETTATVALAAGGAFATFTYTWADGGRPQDGVLLLRLAPEPSALDMVWADSFHMGKELMLCRGEAGSAGSLSALGSYAAPPGPDWGWRIVLSADTPEELHLRMDNITPEGQEALAVEARYSRVAAG